MKKIILIGRSGAGKTTLTQALKGEEIKYHKTQYVNHFESIIDTPGEYAQTHELGYALALYSYEADVVGLLLSAEEPFSLYPPNITCMVNREVVGIITHVDSPKGDPERAERWLRLSGCRKIFRVNTTAGEGVSDILDYLSQDADEKTTSEGSFEENPLLDERKQ